MPSIRLHCLVFLILAVFLVPIVKAQSVTYIYDQDGRVVGVIDPSGNAAGYNYDAVGNITSITRYSSTQVSILSFTPASGPVGTSVTVYGTGFSTTANQNTVKFNGTAATVTSSTANQIVTSVPTGATTGTIQVTSPNGSATSSNSFNVTTSTGAPTITSFTPTTGTSGSALNITGTNYDPNIGNDRILVNNTLTLASSATSTIIATSIPAATTSGRITITTGKGKAVSTADLYIPPQSYQPTDISFEKRIAFPSTQSGVPCTANKVDLMIFDCKAGQRFSVNVDQVTMPGSNVLWAYDPKENQLYWGNFGGSESFFEAATCGTTGTYELATTGLGTGTARFQLYNVPPDQTGTITLSGAAVNVNITTPGQKAEFTFSGTVGQQVSFWGQNQTFNPPYGYLEFFDPTGTDLTNVGFGSPWTFMDKQVLTKNGTYTIKVDPANNETGTMTLNGYNIVDQTGPITLSGSPVSVNITTPGQNAEFTFSGTAGQKVSAWAQGISITGGYINLLDPNGNLVPNGQVYFGSQSQFLDATVLPLTGVYTLQVDPATYYTGTISTLNAYNVVDQTGTLVINGSSLPISITTPGQDGRFTFAGTAGQVVRALLSSNTIAGLGFYILNPDGSTLTDTYVSTSTATLGPTTLPTTGTYTVLIDPAGTDLGTATVQVVSP